MNVPSDAGAARLRCSGERLGHPIALLGLLLVVGFIISLRTNTFLQLDNLMSILRAFSWIAVAAFGEALVLIIGGIDVSVGAVMALAGTISAMTLGWQASVPLAVAFGLAAAAAVGFINGWLTSVFKLPSFVLTLATMSVVRGFVFGLTRGWPVRDLPVAYRILGQADARIGAWPVPAPVLIMLGLALLVALLLHRTVLGRYIYALGRSEPALRASGVDVIRVRWVVYVMGSLLAGIGGIMMTARLGVASPTAASGYELDVIAAAIIGGASLFGGQGGVLGVMLGTLLMQVLRSSVVLLDFPVYWQQVAMGLLVLAAILVDWWRHRALREP